jgi:hypothetical protein
MTRRQQWRRVNLKYENDSSNRELFLESMDLTRPPIQSSVSDPRLTLNGLFDSAVNLLRSTSVPGNSSMETPARHKKKVSFQNSVIRIVLIPTRSEIIRVTKDDPIWWSSDDYIYFKAEAVRELKEIMSAHVNMDAKTAIKYMYQPEFNELLQKTTPKEPKPANMDYIDLEKCDAPTIDAPQDGIATIV